MYKLGTVQGDFDISKLTVTRDDITIDIDMNKTKFKEEYISRETINIYEYTDRELDRAAVYEVGQVEWEVDSHSHVHIKYRRI